MAKRPAGKRPALLNVRKHLENLQGLIELYEEYGDCPIFKDELKMLSFLNRLVLKKHDAQRASGNRKDIRLEAQVHYSEEQQS
jgi:hypothetical protein